MAGPSPRKHKAPDATPSASPSTKRPRPSSPSDKSSTSTVATDANGADQQTDNPAPSPSPATESVHHLQSAPSTDEHDKDSTPTLNVPDYIPDELIPRLERLHLFREPQYNRYSIGYLPTGLKWGEDPSGRWSPYEHLLCYDGKPLLVWMVGVARWVQLKHYKEYSVGLHMLCDRDFDAANSMTTARCEPPQAPKALGSLIFVNKWVGGRTGQDQVFGDVYNAVDRGLRGWDAKQKIDATRVKYSDVVVAEAYVRRFKNKELNTGKEWSHWGVSYDLLRLAVIAEGPASLEAPPTESSAEL